MSKDKKIKQFTVSFDDCTHTFKGTSTPVTCTVTGDVKKFYTPYIIGLIKRKYNNNYQEFVNSYKSRGRKPVSSDEEDDETDLSLYKTFLKLQYRSYTSSDDMSARSKSNTTLDTFNKRFPGESITDIDCI